MWVEYSQGTSMKNVLASEQTTKWLTVGFSWCSTLQRSGSILMAAHATLVSSVETPPV